MVPCNTEQTTTDCFRSFKHSSIVEIQFTNIAINSQCAAHIVELQNGSVFCILNRHKVHKEAESGEKLQIFLLQNFGMYFWILFCLMKDAHERSVHSVLNTFSEGMEEHRNGCAESDQKPIKPSFLPTVANSRCLNYKKGTTAWYVPALFQPPALLFCKETFGAGYVTKKEKCLG